MATSSIDPWAQVDNWIAAFIVSSHDSRILRAEIDAARAADAASLSSSREVLTLSADEREWLEHAASLNGLTIREYVVRAVNDRLRKQGVDAVLLREEGEEDL